jgi:hypothetical protein
MRGYLQQMENPCVTLWGSLHSACNELGDAGLGVYSKHKTIVVNVPMAFLTTLSLPAIILHHGRVDHNY